MLFALIFVVTPLVELAILVYLGTLIGALNTILIVVITGLLGAFLARRQGLATFSRIRNSVEQVGFALLIPLTRNIVTRWFRNFIQRKIERKETLYWRIR